MLDVLVVNPNSRKAVYQSLGTGLVAVEPPIWAGLIAAYVRKRGRGVEILDAEVEGLGADDAAKRAASSGARLAAVTVYGHQPSASTQTMTAAGAFCRALKEAAPQMKVIILGGHVAALPERTLREEAVDFVCDGEGPATVAALTEALASGSLEPSKVPDLWYRDGDGNPARSKASSPLIADLDGELPGMAWDLLPMKKYRAHNWHCFGEPSRQPYASIYTTLGCPYHCTFCCIQSPFRVGERASGVKETVNSYRYWSPKAVLDELELLVTRYGVRHVKFADEMFVLNPKHVEGVCQGIIDRGLSLNIWSYARIDSVRPGWSELLKKAGVNWLAFGIETADEGVGEDVNKGFTLKDVHATVARVREAGINVIGNYIFGLPEDTHATMQATLDMAIELNCEFANFYCTMAYPGSELYRLAVQRGWPLPSTWTGYSQHSADMLPLPTRALPASEVIRFRDAAFEKHFSGQRYLNMVERRFGASVVAEVRAMADHRLERRHAAPTSGPLLA